MIARPDGWYNYIKIVGFFWKLLHVTCFFRAGNAITTFSIDSIIFTTDLTTTFLLKIRNDKTDFLTSLRLLKFIEGEVLLSVTKFYKKSILSVDLLLYNLAT